MRRVQMAGAGLVGGAEGGLWAVLALRGARCAYSATSAPSYPSSFLRGLLCAMSLLATPASRRQRSHGSYLRCCLPRVGSHDCDFTSGFERTKELLTELGAAHVLRDNAKMADFLGSLGTWRQLPRPATKLFCKTLCPHISHCAITSRAGAF